MKNRKKIESAIDAAVQQIKAAISDSTDNPAPPTAIRERNQKLCEGSGEIVEKLNPAQTEGESLRDEVARRGIFEDLHVSPVFKAKIFHADKPSRNERIFPREVMAVNIERCKPRMKEGRLTGRVDHPWGGSMKDTCILWKSMVIDAAGAGFGEYVVVARHSIGADLLANIQAGLKPGFSTSGYGSAHRPSDEEKLRYGLDDDTDVVIIDDDYELRHIDAVDDPACEDAYHIGPVPASKSGQKDSGVSEPPTTETQMFKTIDEMKAKAPDLYKLHEEAVATAVAAAKKSLQEQIDALKPVAEKAEKLQKTVESLNKLIGGLKDISGIELPYREQTAKEAAEQIAKLEADLKAAKAEGEQSASKITELQKQIDEAKAKAADNERRAAVSAKVDELLKDCRWADEVRKDMADEKLVDQSTTDAAVAEKFVKARIERYDAIAGKASSRNEHWHIRDSETSKPQNENKENDDPLAALCV